MVKRRGNVWHIRFRFKKREVWATTQASLKREAERIEQAVKYAIRTGDYNRLDPESRGVCIRIFKNHEWEIPKSLTNPVTKKQDTGTCYSSRIDSLERNGALFEVPGDQR